MEIPRSVRGLVTRRVLVMNYLNGEQITRLKSRVEGMSPGVRFLCFSQAAKYEMICKEETPALVGEERG